MLHNKIFKRLIKARSPKRIGDGLFQLILVRNYKATITYFLTSSGSRLLLMDILITKSTSNFVEIVSNFSRTGRISASLVQAIFKKLSR